jgi:ferrous-iron efflux pump FieF
MITAKTIASEKAVMLLRYGTYASVLTALILIGVKTVAWHMTGSLSILASLVDSLMDALASLINLIAVHLSLKSADEEHSFGHGKAEALAGIGQASFIAGSALILIMHAVERLAVPVSLGSLKTGIGIMIFSIIATIFLLLFQRYVIQKTNSTAIRADSLHYMTDLLTNSTAILALFLAQLGWSMMDPILSLLIAVVIIKSAWHIGWESTQLLMDRQLSPEIREQITATVLNHQDVIDMHNLRTRQSGLIPIIQLHINLDAELTLYKAHSIAKDVEKAILVLFPNADITIHQDPVVKSLKKERKNI